MIETFKNERLSKRKNNKRKIKFRNYDKQWKINFRNDQLEIKKLWEWNKRKIQEKMKNNKNYKKIKNYNIVKLLFLDKWKFLIVL